MSNYSIEFKAMGSHMQAWLSTKSSEDAQILAEMPGWFEKWEGVLSRFRPTSELSYLNSRADKWTPVSPVLFDVIAEARVAAEITNGVFNPLILNALEAVGYDHSFDKQAAVDTRPLPRMADAVPSWESILLDDTRHAVYLPSGARIDLGGIAKGWAAQEAADRLAEYGPCLVDAGGDLVAHGSPDDSEGWMVAVPNLSETGILFRQVLVEETAATSGTDYRQWKRDSQTVNHLIDPRTGRPSESSIVRATVIAPDAAEAVVWAKVSLMTQTFPDYPTVFIYRNGTVQTNVEEKAS